MSLFISLLIIFISLIAYNYKSLKKLYIKRKKKKLEDYFNLYDLIEKVKENQRKETFIFFYSQILVSKFFCKLIIFNQQYNLDTNNPIKIPINKTNKIKSNFTEEIALISNDGQIQKFIINICYHMNNYYQIILDKQENSLSLEIVFYSKKNHFPELIKGNSVSLNNYENHNIPFLKRYNIINISRGEFYNIYDKYSYNQLKEENKHLLKDFNSLFVNFVNKIDEDNFEGKIYKQEENKNFEIFNDDENQLLNITIEFISQNITNKIKKLDASFIRLIYISYLLLIDKIDIKTIYSVIKKLSNN